MSAIEVTSTGGGGGGIRKRLGVFKKPLTASPVSDVHVLNADDDDGDDDEVGEAEHIHQDGEGKEGVMDDPENMHILQSFSSISSASRSSGSGEEEEEEYGSIHPPTRKEGVKANEDTTNDTPKSTIPRRNSSLPLKGPPIRARTVRRGTTTSNFSTFSTFSTRSRSGTRTNTRTNSASSSASWIGYDLSIIVALVSPIGNILTGSDHIKNILLLLFLIYYLHQLVEVPWNLYRMSIPSEELFTPTEDTDPSKLAAYAELRSLEVLYLALTVLSPFLGATLLRLVATAISGNPATLSWFSTSLFVLATGIRPWTHLTERLKSRSRALKALVEEPEASDTEALLGDEEEHVEFEKELSDLRGKYESLDKLFSEHDNASSREWDDLADAIDAVEASVRKYQTEANKRQKEWDARLGVLETYVLDLHRKDRETRLHAAVTGKYLRGARFREVVWEVFALPWSVSAFAWDLTKKVGRRILDGPAPVTGPTHNGIEKHGTPPLNSSFHSQHVLETIVEEDADAQDPLNLNLNLNNAPQKGCIGNGSDSSQTLVSDIHALHFKSGALGARNPMDLVLGLSLRVLAVVFAPAILFVRVLAALLEMPRSVFKAVVH